VSASRINGSWAPAQPLPQSNVTLSLEFRSFASASRLRSLGTTLGRSIAIRWRSRCRCRNLLQRDVPRNYDDSYAAMTDGCTYRGFKHGGQLRWMGNKLAIVAALTEQLVGVGLLEISSTDFRTWDLRRDSKNWNA
jgi:hypothetical protein